MRRNLEYRAAALAHHALKEAQRAQRQAAAIDTAADERLTEVEGAVEDHETRLVVLETP